MEGRSSPEPSQRDPSRRRKLAPSHRPQAHQVFTIALFLVAMLLPLPVDAEPFGPFDAPGHPVTTDARSKGSQETERSLAPAHFLGLSQRFYSLFVSPLHGARCSHRPTCSAYAMAAVRRHGTVVGLWLTVDRLMLDSRSSSLRMLPAIQTPGGVRYLDPLENALFWQARSQPETEGETR